MKYAKIENGIVVQIQPNKEDDFVKVDDFVVCGMIEGEDGSFSKPPPAPPTADEYANHIQVNVLDSEAQNLGYDNAFTAVTYADEPAVPKFQQDGQAIRAWRSEVWAKCYAVLAEVEAGDRPAPTLDELVAELPAFVAP